MPIPIEPIVEDKRNIKRVLYSPREGNETRERSIITGQGLPVPKVSLKGAGTFAQSLETQIMPELEPDQSWRETVLSMPRARDPMVATPRDEFHYTDLKGNEIPKLRPRQRNPMFEGD
jgi:hypothetical protein